MLDTGHRHPRVVAAVRQQPLRFTHTAFQVLPHESAVALARRHASGRSALIAFGGAFHGRTLLGMPLTGKVVPYKAGFGSMLATARPIPSAPSPWCRRRSRRACC